MTRAAPPVPPPRSAKDSLTGDGPRNAPGTEEDQQRGFRSGDIVAIDGSPGDWELMERARAAGIWQIERAHRDNRERFEVHTRHLRPLPDAPHVRRGDLVMQHYPEQTHAAQVTDVFRSGYWMARKTHTRDGQTWSSIDEVNRLVVVTRTQLESAARLPRESGDHRGWILQAIVSRFAGKYRVVCSCLPSIEVSRKGRRIGWCSSLQAAETLWEWHAAGETGPAPDDFTSDDLIAPAPGPRARTGHVTAPATLFDLDPPT